MPIKLINNIV